MDEYPKHGIHWVVVGGESGPKARPMHPEWARSLRDQCVEAGVPYFFKQWGKYFPDDEISVGEELIPGTAVFDVHGERIQPDCCSETYDDTTEEDRPWRFIPAGKKTAGRLLDGREWNEYPSIAEVSA